MSIAIYIYKESSISIGFSSRRPIDTAIDSLRNIWFSAIELPGKSVKSVVGITKNRSASVTRKDQTPHSPPPAVSIRSPIKAPGSPSSADP